MSETSPAPTVTVGRPLRIDGLVLPGTRLEPRPDPAQTAPLVVRIVDVAPHGGLLRYDLEVTGLEPGRHDVAPFLRRADGGATDDLPEIPLSVTGLLEAGRPRVAAPDPVAVGRVGGGTAVAAGLAAAWLAASVLSVWWLRRRSMRSAAVPAATPADELAALVARARTRALDTGEMAAVERLVYDAWRRALHVTDVAPCDLVSRLRRDPAAAVALDRLAGWLHAPRPEMPADTAAFVAALLPPAVGPVGAEGR